MNIKTEWENIVNNEYINTGGNICYNITFYRNKKNPLKQIEIFVNLDRDGKINIGDGVGLNVGTLYEKTTDKYEFIQGDYKEVKTFKNLKEAKKYALQYMKNNPMG